MPTFTFTGDLVAALSSANDDGTGGVNLELDDARNLSGGNPWYSTTDVIEINIPDIGANGEFEPDVLGKVDVNWIKVNGEKITSEQFTIKMGDGNDTYDSDMFFFVEGIDLVFLSPLAGFTFNETDTSGSPPMLNVPERVSNLDLNHDGDTYDAGEVANGIFNIEAVETSFLPDGLDELLSLSDGDDIEDGTSANEMILGQGGNDMVSGEAGHDSILGGAGNDTLFGDAEDTTSLGADTTPLSMRLANLESKTFDGNEASIGDSAVYRDIAQLADGTKIWGRLVLVDKSDPLMTVDLVGPRTGHEILLNGNGAGDIASFRLEFFDPATGEPVALNGVASFNDLDANNATDVEAVILESSSFTEFSASSDTKLAISQSETEIRAAGTELTVSSNQKTWFSAQFEDRTFLEFSLESRSSDSGFSFSGDLISDPTTTVIDHGNDTLEGGDGDDVIFGQGGDDDIDGGIGNDSMSGGFGNDFMSGGDGADTLEGGEGADTLHGGEGADTLFGGSGDDFIEGGAGADVLYTGIGDDTLVGGEGDDTLYNSSGDDSLVGGVGDDLLVASSGDDTLEGETGADTLIGGSDDDSLVGGEGADVLRGDFEAEGLVESSKLFSYEYYELDAVPTLDTLADAGFIGGTENTNPPDGEGVVGGIDPLAIDTYHGGNGDTFAVKLTTTLNVTTAGTYTFDLTSDDGAVIYVNGVELVNNDGVHTVTTVSNSTSLTSGENLIEILYFDASGTETLSVDLTGPDTGGTTIALETGNLSTSFDDILIGGTGDDIITGGIGDDTFVYTVGDGHDTITDFNTGNTGTLIDGNRDNNDFIDLSDYYNDILELHADQADDGVLNQSNDGVGGVDYSDNTRFGAGSLTFTGASADSSSFTSENTGLPCFAPGTLIDTPDGPRAVETLKIGDLVETLDHGPQPILWARTGEQPLEEVETDAKPVLIKAGALGPNLPTQDLIVSPQHRMIVGGSGQLDTWFDEEALAPAKSLTAVPGIRHMKGKQEITWIHFACERHVIVFANGCLSESLLLGPMVMNGLTATDRRALVDIYGIPPTSISALNGPAARHCLKVGDARRHVANCIKEQEQRISNEIRKWDDDLAMDACDKERLCSSESEDPNHGLGIAS